MGSGLASRRVGSSRRFPSTAALRSRSAMQSCCVAHRGATTATSWRLSRVPVRLSAFAVPFDLARLAVTGTPAPIVEDVAANPSTGALFAASDTGIFGYLTGTNDMAGWPILWLEKTGLVRPLHESRGRYRGPSLSPDG